MIYLDQGLAFAGAWVAGEASCRTALTRDASQESHTCFKAQLSANPTGILQRKRKKEWEDLKSKMLSCQLANATPSLSIAFAFSVDADDTGY